MNKIIYFDWSGTLAYPKTRNEMIKGNINVLYPDAIQLLDYLHKQEYIIGIISNTKMQRDKFIAGLKLINVYKYFNGKIILSSDKGMCRKSCNLIFQTADDIYNGYYVGNNFSKDILGAENNGFIGIYIKRDNNDGLIGKYQGNITIRQLNELIDIL